MGAFKTLKALRNAFYITKSRGDYQVMILHALMRKPLAIVTKIDGGVLIKEASNASLSRMKTVTGVLRKIEADFPETLGGDIIIRGYASSPQTQDSLLKELATLKVDLASALEEMGQLERKLEELENAYDEDIIRPKQESVFSPKFLKEISSGDSLVSAASNKSNSFSSKEM